MSTFKSRLLFLLLSYFIMFGIYSQLFIALLTRYPQYLTDIMSLITAFSLVVIALYMPKKRLSHSFKEALTESCLKALLLFLVGGVFLRFIILSSDEYNLLVRCFLQHLVISGVFIGFLTGIIKFQTYSSKTMMIIGAGELGQKIQEALLSKLISPQKILFLDDNPSKYSSLIRGSDVYSIENLKELCVNYQVAEIIIALPMSAEARIKEIIDSLRFSTITIRLVPDVYKVDLLNQTTDQIGRYSIIDIRRSPLYGSSKLVKRSTDILFASIILLLISPLMITIALLVKVTSTGPVFFKQKRYGFSGQPINIVKFRSMYVHVETDGQITQASKEDKRITPLGHFLRRTSLDELPQFINVLRGDMSIVGPRPHATTHDHYYQSLINDYTFRRYVYPGITGLAQIKGWRGETTELEQMRKRIEYDIEYINNWSWWVDIKIIFITIFIIWRQKTAY